MEVHTLNNKRYFIGAIILTILITIQTDQATAVTIKGSVLIVPILCKEHVDHFDHMFFATRNDERLIGTDQNDLMAGFENTWIFGKEGDDCLVGGNGNNVIRGGDGNDVILGGSGTNLIFVGNGNNVIVGGPRNDVIFFGKGNNIIDGGSGVNYCIGKIDNSVIVNCTVVSKDGDAGDKNKVKNVIQDFILGKDLSDSDKNNTNSIPSWINSDLSWWEEGKISDYDIASVLQYLFNMS